MSKESTFNILILLSLISFGILGSASHVFNLAIILLMVFYFLISKSDYSINVSSKKLYLALSSVFFIFTIRSIFEDDTWVSILSLSPMLPIPLIGLMILLSHSKGFSISAQKLEKYAKIAIITTFFVYIIFSQMVAFQLGITKQFLFGRLEIFSGNPIPFSTAVFGITVFCFSNWGYSKVRDKLIALTCVFIGFWLAGMASGTKGTFLAIIISLPILIWLIARSHYVLLLILFFTCILFWLLTTNRVIIDESYYGGIIRNKIDHFLYEITTGNSIRLRLEMWSASISTIRDNFFWGHDVSNRFIALTKHLPETFKNKFTHPHNDIFASIIGAGLIGGVLSIVSLLSPVWASLLSKNNAKEKLFLGILVTFGIFITANVNTIFFNDITSAWLAFSTFLIWNLNYIEKDRQNTSP